MKTLDRSSLLFWTIGVPVVAEAMFLMNAIGFLDELGRGYQVLENKPIASPEDVSRGSSRTIAIYELCRILDAFSRCIYFSTG